MNYFLNYFWFFFNFLLCWPDMKVTKKIKIAKLYPKNTFINSKVKYFFYYLGFVFTNLH